jgi:alpha-D-ribose 1-methylphosphonate 5-triphosphate synthase subunit PhnH
MQSSFKGERMSTTVTSQVVVVNVTCERLTARLSFTGPGIRTDRNVASRLRTELKSHVKRATVLRQRIDIQLTELATWEEISDSVGEILSETHPDRTFVF